METFNPPIWFPAVFRQQWPNKSPNGFPDQGPLKFNLRKPTQKDQSLTFSKLPKKAFEMKEGLEIVCQTLTLFGRNQNS